MRNQIKTVMGGRRKRARSGEQGLREKSIPSPTPPEEAFLSAIDLPRLSRLFHNFRDYTSPHGSATLADRKPHAIFNRDRAD